MKKSLLCAMSLLLLTLICSCSKSDVMDLSDKTTLPEEQPSHEDTTSVPTTPMEGTWVDVPVQQAVSAADFMRYVVGHGWREAHTFDMNDDVTQYFNVQYRATGWGPSRYVFGEDMVTGFYYIDHVPANVYCDGSMRYDETSNKIYFGDNDLFTLLSVNDTEIHAIKEAGVKDDHAGGMKAVYHYVVLQRMTDEELQKTRDTYWINCNDLSRSMTREDLIHKWALILYTNNHYSTHVSDDRNSNKAYIQFFDDGTVTVKDGIITRNGTFDIQFYDGQCATISLKFDGQKPSGSYFLKNVWQSKEIRLRAAANLTLIVDEGSVFAFQRSSTD